MEATSGPPAKSRHVNLAPAGLLDPWQKEQDSPAIFPVWIGVCGSKTSRLLPYLGCRDELAVQILRARPHADANSKTGNSGFLIEAGPATALVERIAALGATRCLPSAHEVGCKAIHAVAADDQKYKKQAGQDERLKACLSHSADVGA